MPFPNWNKLVTQGRAVAVNVPISENEIRIKFSPEVAENSPANEAEETEEPSVPVPDEIEGVPDEIEKLPETGESVESESNGNQKEETATESGNPEEETETKADSSNKNVAEIRDELKKMGVKIPF